MSNSSSTVFLRHHFIRSKRWKIHNLERRKGTSSLILSCLKVALENHILPLLLPQCFSETPSKILKAKLQTTEIHLKEAAQWFTSANTTSVAYNSSFCLFRDASSLAEKQYTRCLFVISFIILSATLTDLVEVLSWC